MIIYANVFKVVGSECREEILKAVGTWTKEKLGYGLLPTNLARDYVKKGEFLSFDRTRKIPSVLKIFRAQLNNTESFSWTLSHPDDTESRRTWITELGMRSIGDETEFSCVTRCEDSTQVKLAAPPSTQPKVVGLIFNNLNENNSISFHSSVSGRQARYLKSDLKPLRDFLREIENPERRHPIVLFSQPFDRPDFYKADFIQSRLFGLAQVVVIDDYADSYRLRMELGDKYSAWNGSINIISPPNRSGRIWTRFALLDEVYSWGGTTQDTARSLLTLLASGSNLATIRRAIRPERVIQDALRAAIESKSLADGSASEEELDALKFNYDRVTQEAAEWKDLIDNEMQILADDIRQKDDEIEKKDAEIWQLKSRLDVIEGQLNQRQASSKSGVPISILEEIIPLLGPPNRITPSLCLKLIEATFPDKVVVLKSAIDSAEQSEGFRFGERLLNLLYRLVAIWPDRLANGGDSAARQVFGKDEYSAQESETVKKSKDLSAYRTFSYDGTDILMLRHLRIGVADSVAETIRVHFHWDANLEQIIIGYCGPHLPLRQ
jgi:hypothetical protein